MQTGVVLATPQEVEHVQAIYRHLVAVELIESHHMLVMEVFADCDTHPEVAALFPAVMN